jgi:hypothetical protein
MSASSSSSATLQLADELRATGPQAGDDGVDVLDGGGDVAETRRVGRRVPVVALVRRRVELHELESSVTVRSLHHRTVNADALEPHDAIHPAALDRKFTLQLEAELDEELGRSPRGRRPRCPRAPSVGSSSARWYYGDAPSLAALDAGLARSFSRW